MFKKITGVALLVCALAFVQTGVVAAEEETTTTTATTSITTQFELLQSLMKQIQELQAKLATLQVQVADVHETLRTDLREGMTDDDIARVQELLASDPELYPEGYVTGYFGSLTSAALERFQARYELEVTGLLDNSTRLMLQAYLTENGKGDIPPGFFNAPGIAKKVETRLSEGCESNGNGNASFCNKLKVEYKDGKFEVESEVEDENTTDEEKAADAIDAAQVKIDVLKAVLEEATADTTDAEAALASAEEKLDAATGAYEEEDYDKAEEFADDAEEITDMALENLDEEISMKTKIRFKVTNN